MIICAWIELTFEAPNQLTFWSFTFYFALKHFSLIATLIIRGSMLTNFLFCTSNTVLKLLIYTLKKSESHGGLSENLIWAWGEGWRAEWLLRNLRRGEYRNPSDVFLAVHVRALQRTDAMRSSGDRPVETGPSPVWIFSKSPWTTDPKHQLRISI